MVTPYLTLGLANISSQKSSSSLAILINVIEEFMLKISDISSAQKYQLNTVTGRGANEKSITTAMKK